MTQDISTEIKRIEQKTAKLEKQKADLLKLQEQREKELKKLDTLVAKSGFGNAKQLIEALMNRFNIAPSQLGRKSSSSGVRTRTTVTAKLRDAIAADLASGLSKAAVGEKHGVSYLVVRGVETGKYKKL